MNIVYSKRAVKVINGLDKPTKKRIRDAVESIPKGDIIPLQGTKDRYRLRIGGWRIIFAYKGDDGILIDKVSPRGDAYKGV